MRSSKTILLALALAALVLPVWAGDDAAADRPQSDKDKSTVAPAQPAKEADEQEHQAPQTRDRVEPAPQPKPREDQAPQSRDRVEPTPQYRSRDSEAPNYGPGAVQVQAPPKPAEARVYGGQSQTGESNDPGRAPQPPTGDRRGGYGGGRGRGGPHFRGGPGWHGHHDEWRHRHFHDSWSFLFLFGPRIYYAPVHYPHVIRIPHDRVGVYVRYTGDDYVGSQFAESVREHLRQEGLRVVYSQDDARLELYVISMEQDPDESGYNSSISVSYIWYPGHKFITAQMVDAGIDEVNDLAESVAVYADDLVNDYR